MKPYKNAEGAVRAVHRGVKKGLRGQAMVTIAKKAKLTLYHFATEQDRRLPEFTHAIDMLNAVISSGGYPSRQASK